VFNVHIENTGDAVEDITFQFVPGAIFGGPFDANKGTHTGLEIPVPIGINHTGTPNSVSVPVALAHIGPVSPGNEGALNYLEHYKLRVFTGKVASNRNIDAGPFASLVSDSKTTTLRKPWDNAGTKTFPGGYGNYSNTFVYDINIPIPGCAVPGRVFVGQRSDPFYINLGRIFDNINLLPAEEFGTTQNPDNNALARNAVTSFALEVSSSCLTTPGGNTVIGGWASVNYLKHVGPTHQHQVGAQKNRLGNPLINELFIGLAYKDGWNYVHPSQEQNFLEYYQYPTLPEIVEVLFGSLVRNVTGITTSLAPDYYPRGDLVQVLLQGVPNVPALCGGCSEAFTTQVTIGVTECGTVTAPPLADMLRLQTDIVTFPVTRLELQNSLSILKLDIGGFPNGRRPGDDIVDIFLRVAMGVLCTAPFEKTGGVLPFCDPSQAPIGGFSVTDGAPVNATDFGSAFPYLNPPYPGSLLPTDPLPPFDSF